LADVGYQVYRELRERIVRVNVERMELKKKIARLDVGIMEQEEKIAQIKNRRKARCQEFEKWLSDSTFNFEMKDGLSDHVQGEEASRVAHTANLWCCSCSPRSGCKTKKCLCKSKRGLCGCSSRLCVNRSEIAKAGNPPHSRRLRKEKPIL
jgi:hypothetical protein